MPRRYLKATAPTTLLATRPARPQRPNHPPREGFKLFQSLPLKRLKALLRLFRRSFFFRFLKKYKKKS